MSSQKTFLRSEIEIGRQLLLEAIFTEQPDDRFRKREAVRELLSTLLAARKRGMTFGRIAEILRKAGVDLPAETLRTYFFQSKTQQELAADATEHALKIGSTLESIEKEVREKHAEHGNVNAFRRARMTRKAPALTDAFKEGAQHSESFAPVVAPIESELSARKMTRKRESAPPRPPVEAPLPLAVETASIETEPTSVSNLTPRRSVDVYDLSQDKVEIVSRADKTSKAALSLDAIEEASQATEERTVLLEDLELREGELVFYTSGKPFHGFLSERQIWLLWKVGKVIAPTISRTSKDFVKMPNNL